MRPRHRRARASGRRGVARRRFDEAYHDGKTVISVKNLAPRILSPQVSYLLADMMADVIRRGTGQRARSLNRDDIAGKTGTSNEAHDTWFNGFMATWSTTVWVWLRLGSLVG